MSVPVTEPFKVLVVDDIEDNLLVMEALLRRPDLEIMLARSGSEALEILLQNDIVLALLDVQMPQMNGFDLAELMRGTERTRAIPIIFVTAGVQDQQRVFRGYELGAVDFLFKPVEPAILRQKVEVFLELRRQREELRDALRLNEMFVAVLAHDLRTPLSNISMSADLLAATGDPATSSLVARVRRSTQRMANMIAQLCDLSRARLGGGFVLDRSQFDLVPLVRRIVQELEVQAPDHRFALELPATLVVRWDESRIAQVLSNLVGNAVRHGEAREPITIAVGTADASTVVIRVGNAGAVPAAVQAQLFTPFKTQQGQREGLGLGLYIAQQIVLSHDGRIEVTSDAESTTAIVELPLL